MAGIVFTQAAEDYLADLLSKQDSEGVGIRVFITQPGTPYAETCIAYCKPGEQKPEDELLKLDVTSMTPLEAINKLYELQENAREGG